MRVFTSGVFLAIIFAIVNPSIGQDGYGSVAGQVVFGGKRPRQKVLVPGGAGRVRIAGQPQVFPPRDILDESLLIDDESRGVANVMVWPLEVDSIHPRYQSREPDPIDMSVLDGQLAPRVVHIGTKQAIRFRATKGSLTNILIEPRRNDSINVLVPEQTWAGITLPGFQFAEHRPLKLTSNLHPWITGWIKVSDHPYGGVSDSRGMFQINWLPAGEYRFAVWHEQTGFLERNLKVTILDRKVTRLEPIRFFRTTREDD